MTSDATTWRDALRESRVRLDVALTAARAGTFRWTPHEGTVALDPHLSALFGAGSRQMILSFDEFLGFVHDADREEVAARAPRAAGDGSDFHLEFRAVRPDGNVRWIELHAVTTTDDVDHRPHVVGACIDVTDRKIAEETLRAKEERLRAIFTHAAVGIAVAELNGHFSDMNRKFPEILGYTSAELQRLTFMELTHPDDRAETAECVRRLLAGVIPEYVVEKRYVRKDRSFVWSLTTVTLLTDAAGRPQRFIGVIEDITVRKETDAALLAASEERKTLLERERAARSTAERMSNVKDEFLATLSHELRTPLNAILGWSQVLKTSAKGPADIRKGLDIIERNARAQTELIEDLLDMSRIASGKIRLDIQTVVPAACIEAALETVRPAADAKGIRLDTSLDPTIDPISGDPGRLQQVIWNLLSNAIKFTPRDGTVRVTLSRVDSFVQIAVADTGVGVRKEFLPNLFERFRQADASTTREYGGLGLGLSIVKSLVELHGGTVMASSDGEGRGTTIVVRLPMTASPHRRREDLWPHPGRAPISAAHARELAGLCILVVEDQPDTRELIKRVLEDRAAEVITAGAADEALRSMDVKAPDVLVSDIGMPEVDGFEFLERVRARDAAKGGAVPAIALTAFARAEDRSRAIRAGFAVHMTKPFDPEELVATVANVVGRRPA